MFGCGDVIPPKFKDVDQAWIGTDNASWIMRAKKRIQYWLAIGPRGNHWYCKTRELPKTLIAWHGKGPLRYENSDGSQMFKKSRPDVYLSRIQIWTRWAIIIQWPLLFFFHRFWKEEDVIQFPKYKSDHGIKKFVHGLIGYKRDGDRWHILTVFFGGNSE